MAEALRIDALGAVVEIDLSEVSDAVRHAVADVWRDAIAIPEARAVDATVSPMRGDVVEVLADLSQRVTLAAIEARRGELWMLHAAGLALPDGRVVALIGPSGRGKTTASRALGVSYGYVSDETVAIDVDGRVWPYRKPLSIIEVQGQAKTQRSPSSLGLLALPDAPLRLAAIAMLDRQIKTDAENGISADLPFIEPIDLGDAVPELVAQSSYLADMPHALRTFAALAAAVGGVQRVAYQEASSLRELVTALAEVDAVDSEAAAASVSPPEPGRLPGPGPIYSRAPVHDQLQLADPDRVVLLQLDASGSGMVRVLSGIAPELWRRADSATLDDLVEAAVETYGAPPGMDATAMVQGALTDLVAADAVIEVRPGWSIRDDVAWTGEGDRFVALSLSDEKCLPRALEGSAALVWQALADGGGPADQVVSRVAEAAGADEEIVAGDVAAFLATLEAQGLISKR